jgi:hypothetical protein
MMKDGQTDRWRELNWRRELTPEEMTQLRAWWGAHPESRADWELESELTQALERLPDVPIASNFTARVLDAAARAEAQAARARPFAWAWRWLDWRARWLPKAAWTAVFLTAGLLSVQHVRENHRRAVAKSVLTVSQVAGAASTEILEDFDAIQALNQTPADEELLALFK